MIGESSSRAIGVAGVSLGKYAIYISIVLNLVYAFLYAVKLNNLDVGLMGIGFALLALMLQYSAVKSCNSIMHLMRATTFRMSSRSFFDSMVIIMFMGGVVLLAVCAVVAIRTANIPVMIAGFALFLAFEEMGVILLHPESMGITFTKSARVGEEAIAIISFIWMLPMRYVSSIFGTGVTLSTVGTIAAFYLFFQEKQDPEILAISPSFHVALLSGSTALVCAAYPILSYVYFLFAFVWIDLVQSILEIPRKLDRQTSSSRTNGESSHSDAIRVGDADAQISG